MKKRVRYHILTSVVIGVYFLLSILGVFYRPARPPLLVLGSIPPIFLFSFLLWDLVRHPESTLTLRRVLFSLFLTNLSIQSSGGLNSPLSAFYYLLILFSAVRGATSLPLLLFGAVLCLELPPSLRKGYFETIHLYHLCGLGLFSVFSGRLLAQGRRLRQELEAKLVGDKRHYTLSPADIDRESVLKTLSGGEVKGDLRWLSILGGSLASLIDLVSKEFEPYTTALFLSDRKEGRLHLYTFKSRSGKVKKNAVVVPGAGVVGWVAKEKRELFSEEFTNPYESLGYYERDEFIRSVAALPVLLGSELQGVLTIDSRGEREYTLEERERLRGFARQISTLMHFGRQAEAMKAEALRFSAFQELAKSFSREIELHRVLDLILEASESVFTFDLLAIVLTDNGDFRIERALGDRGRLSEGLSFDPQDSLVGLMAKNSTPLTIGNLTKRRVKTPMFFDDENLPKGFESFLGAPVLVKEERVIGALVFLSREREAYSEKESQLLHFLVSLSSSAIEKARLYESTKSLAIRDGLTGLFNHRHFQELLAEETEKKSSPVCLLLIDIDRFKRLNDRYGHPAGDEVLKELAKLLERSDGKRTAARYGGEEFAVILPGVGEEEGFRIGESVRDSIENTLFQVQGESLRITVSIGVATYPGQAQGREDLISMADKALYKAKEQGRNRVVGAGTA